MSHSKIPSKTKRVFENRFALQSPIGSLQPQQLDLSVQAFNLNDVNHQVKSKPREAVKITPVATNPKFVQTSTLNLNASSMGSLHQSPALNSPSIGTDNASTSQQQTNGQQTNKNQPTQIIAKVPARKNSSTKSLNLRIIK